MPFGVTSAVHRRWVLAFFVGFVIACGVAAFIQQKRAHDMRQLVSDIARLEPAAGAYGIEAQQLNPTAEDQDWKTYCYQQRAALIADVHSTTP